jgi:hypothetical protein
MLSVRRYTITAEVGGTTQALAVESQVASVKSVRTAFVDVARLTWIVSAGWETFVGFVMQDPDGCRKAFAHALGVVAPSSTCPVTRSRVADAGTLAPRSTFTFAGYGV